MWGRGFLGPMGRGAGALYSPLGVYDLHVSSCFICLYHMIQDKKHLRVAYESSMGPCTYDVNEIFGIFDSLSHLTAFGTDLYY